MQHMPCLCCGAGGHIVRAHAHAGLTLKGQMMLVADPLALEEKKGLARWRCPGENCVHQPNTPARLWRHILANPTHLPQGISMGLFAACMIEAGTGRRIVYVSDLVGLVGERSDMDFIGKHTVHERIHGALDLTHPRIPNRTATPDPPARDPLPAHTLKRTATPDPPRTATSDPPTSDPAMKPSKKRRTGPGPAPQPCILRPSPLHLPARSARTRSRDMRTCAGRWLSTRHSCPSRSWRT